MTNDRVFYWEYPVEGPSLASSPALVEWVGRIGAAIEDKVGDLALVDAHIDAVQSSAGEVLRIADPEGRGPDIEFLVERIPGGAIEESYAFVFVHALIPGALPGQSRLARVDVEAGYVFGPADLRDGARLEFSRGDANLVDKVAEVIERGMTWTERGFWRRLQIDLPPYGRSIPDA